jgi:hypothetical protein
MTLFYDGLLILEKSSPLPAAVLAHGPYNDCAMLRQLVSAAHEV